MAEKKKPFTRPKGWQKKLKRSHFDESKTAWGEKYSNLTKSDKEKEEQKKKAKKQKWGLIKALFGAGEKKE